eukprot:gnl/MRDRNA2_/MRDRNA2_51824_c0_seq1.p1 gnl/MRDRNA2_/MRDRNA2_51824_c0~~gnl/MRDRNA2_/MRDRNA2_51824_c0_seq1.p1  ORF type:complete len:308 (+),score=56.13 gnl/MRDRNA2_/MRDRNA2_51824_c0_seq1:82-1005(+)
MCRVIGIFFIACVAQAETNAKDSMEDVINQLNTNDELVDQLVDKLVNRALEAVKQQDLDEATVAKIRRGLNPATRETINAPSPGPVQVRTNAPAPKVAPSPPPAPSTATPTSPTGNATLDKILEAKWAAKINAGPHSCTAEDQEAIMKMPNGHADDSWGAIITDCAHEGLNLIFGINQATVNKCLATKLKISPKCSKCYSAMTEYDFQNCKLPCLTTWCSDACIKCNHGSNVIGCIGFVDPQPTVCSGGITGQFVEYDPSITSNVNFTGVTLMGLFMFSGIIFSMLHLSRRSSFVYPKREPLMGANQ